MEIVNTIYFCLISVLLFILVYRRMKIKHISFSWHTGLMYGFPFFPTILLVFSFVIFSVSLIFSSQHFMSQAGIFLVNSVFTFFVSWLYVERIVSDDRLYLHPFIPGKIIVLNDIIDYFFQTTGILTKVTIIYLHHAKTKSISFILPSRYIKLLDHLLEPKISTPKKSTLFTQFIQKEN